MKYNKPVKIVKVKERIKAIPNEIGELEKQLELDLDPETKNQVISQLTALQEEQIMLDGKAIRSTESIKTIDTMMNIVTAYTDTGISLCQIPVDSKNN